MRVHSIALVGCLGVVGTVIAQDASRSGDAPIESKTQTANSAPQTVNETKNSRKHEANEHLTDGLNTTHSRDARKKDEYGTPLPAAPKGQGTNSSTDAQRAADPKPP